jgi:NAD(P)-dependent dehydrogenase (short-subunit alcohol dehydrogenase family)
MSWNAFRRQGAEAMSGWTAEQMPDQTGRLAVVTGGSSGLGVITARELARKGAHVVLAVRTASKGETVAQDIRGSVPGAEVEVRELDLASLDSVRAFAKRMNDEGAALDLLVNNAGIMMTPPQKTSDGHELQFGTNHLGHFALTGLLLDALGRASAPRVVTVSSIEHKPGHIHFDDLQLERGYGARKAYQQSKMANAVFAIELDRRLRAAGSPILSVLAHPGYSATNLQSTGPTGVAALAMKISNAVVAQKPERGALPQLYAATAPGVEGGQFFGPSGFQEMRGDVTEVQAVPEAHDPEIGRRLWEVSEELTGVSFALPVAAG